MKVKDYLLETGTKGFFPLMESIQPETYKALFGETDPLLVDNIAFRLYGERELMNMFSQDTASYMVNGILVCFADGWKRQMEVINTEYNLLNPVNGKTETTITESVDETGNQSDTKQSTTFNDGDFGNDERNTNETTGKRESSRTQTTTESGNKGGLPVSTIIAKEINLRKTNVRNYIIRELIGELTLQVY